MSGLLQVDDIKNSAGTGGPTFSNGVSGVTSASSAVAGTVGEVISASGSGTLSSSVSNFASIALTAGDWILSLVGGGTSSNAGVDFVQMAISANSASFTGTTQGDTLFLMGRTPSNNFIPVGCLAGVHVNISSGATYYAVGNVNASSTPGFARITAVRIR